MKFVDDDDDDTVLSEKRMWRNLVPSPFRPSKHATPKLPFTAGSGPQKQKCW